MFVFRKIWRALFSWNTRFEICPFTLLPTISCTEIPDRYAFEVEVRRVEWPLKTNNPSLSICRLLKYGLPHGFWYNLEATEIYIQLSLMFLNASDAHLRQTPHTVLDPSSTQKCSFGGSLPFLQLLCNLWKVKIWASSDLTRHQDIEASRSYIQTGPCRSPRSRCQSH